jgi:hypothetical protein
MSILLWVRKGSIVFWVPVKDLSLEKVQGLPSTSSLTHCHSLHDSFSELSICKVFIFVKLKFEFRINILHVNTDSCIFSSSLDTPNLAELEHN